MASANKKSYSCIGFISFISETSPHNFSEAVIPNSGIENAGNKVFKSDFLLFSISLINFSANFLEFREASM